MSSGDPVPPQLLQLSDNKLFFPRWLWLVIHCRFLALVLHFLVECVWTPQLTHFFSTTLVIGQSQFLWDFFLLAESGAELGAGGGSRTSLVLPSLCFILNCYKHFSWLAFFLLFYSIFLLFPSCFFLLFFPPLFFSSFPSFLLIKLIFYTDNSLLIFTILLYIIIKSY